VGTLIDDLFELALARARDNRLEKEESSYLKNALLIEGPDSGIELCLPGAVRDHSWS